MSEENTQGGLNWGKVLVGAAVVTAAAAACIYMPSIGSALKIGTDLVGGIIREFGNSIVGVGALIKEAVKQVAEHDSKAAVFTAAAITGAAVVAGTTSFVDRLNRATEPVTGRAV